MSEVYEVHIHPAAAPAPDEAARRAALEALLRATLDPLPWRLLARDDAPDRFVVLCDGAGLTRLQWRDIETGARWLTRHRLLGAAALTRYREKLGALPWDNVKA